MARRFISLTLFFSFLILFWASIALYFIPGSSSGSAGWTFMGVSRRGWIDLHLTSGLVFLFFGLIHTGLNWRGLWRGIRNARLLKAAWPLLGALALNVFLVVGTIHHLQPVEGLLTFYKDTKQRFRNATV